MEDARCLIEVSWRVSYWRVSWHEIPMHESWELINWDRCWESSPGSAQDEPPLPGPEGWDSTHLVVNWLSIVAMCSLIVNCQLIVIGCMCSLIGNWLSLVACCDGLSNDRFSIKARWGHFVSCHVMSCHTRTQTEIVQVIHVTHSNFPPSHTLDIRHWTERRWHHGLPLSGFLLQVSTSWEWPKMGVDLSGGDPMGGWWTRGTEDRFSQKNPRRAHRLWFSALWNLVRSQWPDLPEKFPLHRRRQIQDRWLDASAWNGLLDKISSFSFNPPSRGLQHFRLTWHDETWEDIKQQHDMKWHEMTMTWNDMTWNDMRWHEVTWLEINHMKLNEHQWTYMTWHDMTWHDMTWHDMTWHDMTWHDMRHDLTRHYMTWQDMTWRDMTWTDMMCWATKAFYVSRERSMLYLGSYRVYGGYMVSDIDGDDLRWIIISNEDAWFWVDLTEDVWVLCQPHRN